AGEIVAALAELRRVDAEEADALPGKVEGVAVDHAGAAIEITARRRDGAGHAPRRAAALAGDMQHAGDQRDDDEPERERGGGAHDGLSIRSIVRQTPRRAAAHATSG